MFNSHLRSEARDTAAETKGYNRKQRAGMDDERIGLEGSEGTENKAVKKASRASARRKKNKKADSGRFIIARLLALVCMVLVVFEGRIIVTLFTHRVGSNISVMSSRNENSDGNETVQGQDEGDGVNAAQTAQTPAAQTPAGQSTILGLAGAGSGSPQLAEETPATDQAASIESIDSPAVVASQNTPVDDSYFSNAVFIGDSRVEGFRNSSGINQGTFLTGISLSTNDMSDQIISTADGTISVYQGLSGRQYDRIYLMLGANDLGYYPWENFLPTFESVLQQFHELQPHAIIYVCSVIYVDESKIAAGFEYDNNDNVRTINGYILQACEDLWYSYYLNLNEIFSDGYGSLISDASSDGIHLYADYLEKMLKYLKNHYITEEDFAAETANHPDDIANAPDRDETEVESEPQEQPVSAS